MENDIVKRKDVCDDDVIIECGDGDVCVNDVWGVCGVIVSDDDDVGGIEC